MIYVIEFTEEELQILNDALIEMPFKKAAPVIAAINKQIALQESGSNPNNEVTKKGS